jgi:t-SNARE complex subunit (syntaxin)
VLRQSQQIQTEFKNIIKNRLKAQIKIVKPAATDDELDRIANNPVEAK